MPKTIRCRFCGRVLKDGKFIASKFTGDYYCPPDQWQECEDRSIELMEALEEGRKR